MITTFRKKGIGNYDQKRRSDTSKQHMTALLIIITLLIIGLIFAVAFLFVYHFDDVNSSSTEVDFDVLPITSDNIGMDFYLGRNATGTRLIDIYETPHSEAYLDISFVFNTFPGTLEFSLHDDDNVKVTGDPTVLKSYDGFREWRYSFTPNGSEKYTLKYSLGNEAYNVSNVRIQRVELKVPRISS